MQTIDYILNTLREDSRIGTVLYESPYSANLRIDRLPSPYAILYLIQSMDVDVSGNRYFKTLSIELFLCKPTDLSADGAKVQAACDDMIPIAENFIHKLADSRLFEFDKVKMRQAYGKFDKNVSGLSIEIDLKERIPTCFTEYIPEEPEQQEENGNTDNEQNQD